MTAEQNPVLSNVLPGGQPNELLTLYIKKDWDGLTARFLDAFRHFVEVVYTSLSADAQCQIDTFVKDFLFIFTQPDYIIPMGSRLALIQLNAVISNVVAISSSRNTDPWLPLLHRQKDNLSKILPLYSARNTVHIDVKLLFDANPRLVSVWYCEYVRTFQSVLMDKGCSERLVRHIRSVDPRWTLPDNFHDVYFASTYIDAEADRYVKSHINGEIQRHMAATATAPIDGLHRIGIVTGFWSRMHSALRIQYDFIASLQEDYDLVLIALGPKRSDMDTGIFKEVHYLEMQAGTLPLEHFRDHCYRMLYYPEIGMMAEAIVLSNVRLAPIQVVGCGHPVSTHGSEIDYFVSSERVEDESLLAHNYTERVVLLPGLGVCHAAPPFSPPERAPRPSQRLVINCSWYAQKVHSTLLEALAAILEQCSCKPLLRIFPGAALQRDNHFIPFTRSMQAALGADNVEVVPTLPYAEYMAMLADADMALDSFPFGGSNVVVDDLHLRKPILTLRGKHWYNRIGPAMLDRLGLAELVARSPDEYIETAVRLIQDGAFRSGLQTRLDNLDLNHLLYSREEVPDFRAAIDYLMTHHETIQQEGLRSPLRMRELVAPRR